jgi:hypothetical protein
MSFKKIIVALVIILVAVGGFVAGLYLLQRNTELREEAAVPGGQATVSIDPTSGTYDVGDTIQASVFFNTANIAVSGVAVRLTYPFSGTDPEVEVTSVDISPTILSSEDWNCPTKSSTEQGTNVVVDIGCANISSSGFTTSGDTLLATITMKVNREPESGDLTVRFDPQQSIITQKSTGEDILLIPTSSGSYTVSGTAEPTPTSEVTTTVTTTTTPTPTKTVTGTVTKTPTPTSAELPDAGVSYPTIMGIGLGALVIFGSLLFLF